MIEAIDTTALVHSMLEPPGASVEWRCAGCDSRIHGNAQGLPAFCPFCREWAQWRRRDDELWAQATSGWEDDGGQPSASHADHPVAYP
jgi:hypothetical protein